MDKEKKVVMVTKQNCPKCVQIKMYMDNALTEEQRKVIEVVKKEENLEKYLKLVEDYQIESVPAMIDDKGTVYRNVTPILVKKLVS